MSPKTIPSAERPNAARPGFPACGEESCRGRVVRAGLIEVLLRRLASTALGGIASGEDYQTILQITGQITPKVTYTALSC